MIPKKNKNLRHQKLLEALRDNPFLTDEELARILGVSIQTIRLDRMELDVAELRERIKNIASGFHGGEQFIQGYKTIADILEIEPGKRIISLLVIGNEMTVPGNSLVRPYYLVAQAHSAALHLFPNQEKVFTAAANVKFSRPVKVKERLVAVAELVESREDRHRVKVTIRSEQEKVFRATFHVFSDHSEGEHHE